MSSKYTVTKMQLVFLLPQVMPFHLGVSIGYKTFSILWTILWDAKVTSKRLITHNLHRTQNGCFGEWQTKILKLQQGKVAHLSHCQSPWNCVYFPSCCSKPLWLISSYTNEDILSEFSEKECNAWKILSVITSKTMKSQETITHRPINMKVSVSTSCLSSFSLPCFKSLKWPRIEQC